MFKYYIQSPPQTLFFVPLAAFLLPGPDPVAVLFTGWSSAVAFDAARFRPRGLPDSDSTAEDSTGDVVPLASASEGVVPV